MPTVWNPLPSAATEIRWPTSREVAARDSLADRFRRLKHSWRVWRSRESFERIQAVAHAHPCVAALIKTHPRLLCPLGAWFMDRRWQASQRAAAMAATLTRTQDAFSEHARWQIANGRLVPLIDIDERYHLALGLNELSYHEGFWSLSLRDTQQRRLFNLSFCWLPDGAVLIGSIQGPNGDDRLEQIRDLTKAAHGLRPPHLLIEALRALLLRTAGASTILGIDPDHHVKGRWNLKGNRLKFDYRAFWTELEARPPSPSSARSDEQHALYWQIPGLRAQRDLAEVPSRKRAMYRRREEWLDALQHAMANMP